MKKTEKTITRQLPVREATLLVSDLIEGRITHEEIANKYNISADTVTRYAKLHAETIGNVKKKIQEEIFADTIVRVRKFANKLLEFAENCLQEASYKNKLKKLNPVQLMTAMAIAVDKRQLLTGGATERTEFKFTTKDEVLAALTSDQNLQNGANVNMIEKSITFKSATILENNKENLEIKKPTQEEIKNILKNQGLLK